MNPEMADLVLKEVLALRAEFEERFKGVYEGIGTLRDQVSRLEYQMARLRAEVAALLADVKSLPRTED